MTKNVDKKALLEKEALPGEIHEGETAEVLKETSARRRWVALCWLLTWWVPTPFLRWFRRMKCMDVRQAWREKLARAQHYYLVHLCLCRLRFGNLICPMEHVFSTSELASQCGEQRRQYLRRHSWGSV
jgi:chitin synthase